VLAAADRVSIDADQPEQTGGGAGDLVAEHLAVASHRWRRRCERAQDRHRCRGRAAGRVNHKVGVLAHGSDPLAGLAPLGQALLPKRRLRRGVFVRRKALLACVVLVDPGPEVGGVQVGKSEQEVGHVAFGVDDDGRDAVHGGFFEQRDAEPGFTAAGHADANPVGHEIFGVVEQGANLRFAAVKVIRASKVEDAQLLKIVDRDPLLCTKV
jgi:hypothetical protein